MIEEAYVSFETAKLLKERKFDIPIRTHYDSRGGFGFWDMGDINWNNYKVWKNFGKTTSAPTQSLVMRWLRETYNIDIIVTLSMQFPIKHYKAKIYCKLDNPFFLNDFSRTYEDETERAIKYCVGNLI